IKHRIYLPEQFEWALQYPVDDDNAHHITGCIFSSLLTARYGYPSTLGYVGEEDAQVHLSGLVKYGFTAANLHCGTYRLSPERITAFKGAFGRADAAPVELRFNKALLQQRLPA
ncbi:MAG TPA: hypothetical protein VLC08_12755, partial [Chitinolyticbacter sp.]|nr:hypothetical protein [Chitinolyticbacter sp.]